MSLHLPAWMTPWRAKEETERAAERVDRAADLVRESNMDVKQAALDHAESSEYVRTTLEAVLEKLSRRDLRSGESDGA